MVQRTSENRGATNDRALPQFSLLQLLLVLTGICVLCAVLVNVPVSRGVLAGLVFIYGPSLLLVRLARDWPARWMWAVSGAWIGGAFWIYMNYPAPVRFSSAVAEALGAAFLMGCIVGTIVNAAVGKR